jgi:outer membrane receptor protein involved in Fe transport
MTKKLSGFILLLTACLLSIQSYAQSVTIKGNVKNAATKENVIAVSVAVKSTSVGVFTDDKGNFTLRVPSLPVTLVISSVGYETKEVVVNSPSDFVQVEVNTAATLGQEVVVSATRVATKILESPVSIERVNATTIRNAPAASYYDVINNLKGVDVMASSLTFKTPTTRGFLGSGNTRFTQIVDGMDNQAPGLNFSVGSVIGLSELDVDNMELLPGASSALYGPGGMNGTLLVTSKNPFKYQGLSMQVKQGIMHTDKRFRNASPYYNWTIRLAQKIGNKFAFKVTGELIQAQDWLAADYRNYDRANSRAVAGNRLTNPDYDGVNTYGDENKIDIRPIINNFSAIPGYSALIATLPATIPVTRTGYTEKEIVDPTTINFKIGGSLNYKITNNIEAILSGFWGTGNTVYTGSDRYSLKNLKMGQYKFELNSKNWLLRAYTTQENSGSSYNATAAISFFNEAWKPSQQWIPEYVSAYLNNRLTLGMTDQQAHINARNVADVGRPLAGSADFKRIFNFITSVPIGKPTGGAPLGGGLFLDRTDLYAIDGQYNLSHVTKEFADVLIGGNFRQFSLNSQGTLFADSTGPIAINEFGGFIQVAKSLFNDIVKLTVSGRYDKNQNFKGRFTPRATALVKVNQNNNIRISYQTAYRFPSTQQQWINLLVGGSVQLIGGNEDFRSFYNLNGNPVFALVNGVPTSEQVTVTDFKPESVNSIEVGFKGLNLNNKLLIDVYGYYGQYQDFLTRRLVMQNPTNAATRKTFSIPVNTTTKVKTFGFGIGLDYKLPLNFSIGANFSSDQLDNVPAGFQTFFSTPKYRTNVTFANTGFGKNNAFSFSVVYKWMDSFLYESDFITGTVPATNILDAQVSYKVPKTKCLVKVGGNNILNQYYVAGIGNPAIGGLYYASVGFNVF